MMEVTLEDLQASVRDTTAFNTLEEYQRLCKVFLELITRIQPIRIISPTHNNYAFFQYSESYRLWPPQSSPSCSSPCPLVRYRVERLFPVMSIYYLLHYYDEGRIHTTRTQSIPATGTNR